MTTVWEPFYRLTSASLGELAEQLAGGALARELSVHVVQQLAGPSLAPALTESLGQLSDQGWRSEHVAELLLAIREARAQAANPEGLFDVVLTGPDVQGVPTRDTAAVMHEMVEEAEEAEEVVLLVGYAVYNGKKIFKRLAEKMRDNPGLRVQFILNIQRTYGDTSLDSEIVRRFAVEFASKHWPWSQKPEVFYDPRALQLDSSERASLHAKCIVVDRRIAIITSANFTEAAQYRNIEAGVVVAYAPFVQRITDYFLGLKQEVLEVCPVPERPNP